MVYNQQILPCQLAFMSIILPSFILSISMDYDQVYDRSALWSDGLCCVFFSVVCIGLAKGVVHTSTEGSKGSGSYVY